MILMMMDFTTLTTPWPSACRNRNMSDVNMKSVLDVFETFCPLKALAIVLGKGDVGFGVLLSKTIHKAQLRVENPRSFAGLFQWANRLLHRFEKLGF